MSAGPRVVARRVGNALAALLFAVVMVVGVALVLVPKLTGSVPLTVLTGSMSGSYEPGDVVIARPVTPDEIEVGDAITYQPTPKDPTVVTHRVVAEVFSADGSIAYLTQGDANGARDPDPVRPVQIRGKVWYSVPWVGHATALLSPQWRENGVKVVAVGLVLYGFTLVGAGVRDRRRRTSAPAAAPTETPAGRGRSQSRR